MQHFDVIIIGYGPTGKVLARSLSDAGHSVAIVERWPAAYPLPRAVGYDHEIKRIFHKLGLAEQIEAVSRPMGHYTWYNADWKVLIDIPHVAQSVSGGPEGFLFNQPELEEILERDLQGRPGLTFFLGHEALKIDKAPDEVSLTLVQFPGLDQPIDPATMQTISAKYLVGCDGANSIVRETMGCEVHNHGFDSDWLVVDVMPNEGTELPVPDAAQWCNPERPTTIVPSGVNNRRWEFMVMPGENPEDLVKEEKVWELLAQWMTPQDGTLVRAATYNFRSRLARGWRKGRMMIAGDAAHVMPPFMGQGMCSGLRDAWNLGWKLDAVLSGKASDALLDTYEAERAPHADAVINISMEMGKVICVPDPAAAAARDEAFFSGNVPPPPQFPPLLAGMVDTDEMGALRGLAGQYMPHVIVNEAGTAKRLDDVQAGRGFTVLVNGLSHDSMTPAVMDAIQRLGAAVVPFGTRFEDTEGRIKDLFAGSGAKAILVRPDFYAFGSATSAAEAEALLVKAADHFDQTIAEAVA